jgi:hypothetical protein
MSTISSHPKVIIAVELTYTNPVTNANGLTTNGQIEVELTAYSMKLSASSNTALIGSTVLQPSKPVTSISIMPDLSTSSIIPNGIYLLFYDKDGIFTNIKTTILNVFFQSTGSIYEINNNPYNVQMPNNAYGYYSLFRLTKFPDPTQNIKDAVFLSALKHYVELIILNMTPSDKILLQPVNFTPNVKSEMYGLVNSYIGGI